MVFGLAILGNNSAGNFSLQASFAASIALASFTFALVGFAHAQSFEPVAELTGVATVKDGDGLLFGSVEIRLQGIAAPELRDPVGQASTDTLRRLADGKRVVCYLDGTRAGKSKRPVAVCTVDGRDLGELQVLAGMALDCPRYSKGRYAEAERKAVAEDRNLALTYQLPGYCR